MKALLLDIGNSRLKWGLLRDGAIRRIGNIRLGTIREQGISILGSRLPRDADSVIACNVAGKDFAASLSGFIGSQRGYHVRFVRAEAAACGVTNGYRQPHRLGVDRWVAMIGARASCGTSCLVVDAGTATTLDALDAAGRHLGGQILPGLMLMADSLGENASDLPNAGKRISTTDSSLETFARSTAAGIAQGIIAASAGAVERALRVLRQKERNPTLLLTGGGAAILQRSLNEAAQIRPNLVLEGLARILTEQT